MGEINVLYPERSVRHGCLDTKLCREQRTALFRPFPFIQGLGGKSRLVPRIIDDVSVDGVVRVSISVLAIPLSESLM